ncbi:MAG: hypothetical protein GX159_09395 [Flavobacteriaceae bacterium]|nr:hypothetical protein [Flavobacteriaceae bacterium]
MELIFKIICCSAVFIGFYHFVLQREKMFRFNRFYLLATLVLSFSIPFMELGIREFYTPNFQEFIPLIQQSRIHEIPENSRVHLASVPIENLVETPKTIPTFSWIEILGAIGVLISLAFLVRFVLNLWKINRLAKENEKVQKEGFTLVKINRNVSPFSFFHYLFASKQEVENENLRSEIFYHELAHIRQKHSWDVVFIEFLLIFFWFNPFLYIYRKSIRTNHEFLADEEVLNHDFDTLAYQQLLLEKIPVKSQTSLSSSFNYLVTKKRLIMMTKQTSKIKTIAIKFFSIPLLVAVMLVFSEKVSAQIEPGKGVSKELFREYKKQIRKATVKEKDENGNKIKKIDTSKLDKELMSEVYAQMSPEQKMKVQPIPTKKQIAFEFNGEDFQMNFDDFKLDEIVKMGLNTADLGLKISEGFGNINIDTEYFNSPEWKAQIEKIEKNAADMDAYYNSPEWKKYIEEIEKNAKRVAEYYNSPEWKKYIEGIEANAKRIEDYYNSPEWKAQVEKIEKSAAELEEYFNSPEWKNKQEEIKKTVEKFNNPQAINLRNEAFEFRNKALEWRDEAFQFRNKAMEIRNKATKIRSEASKLPFDSKERRLLMGQYDEEMRKYNVEMEKYNREMGKYNAEMARYNEKMNLYQASLNS